PYPFILLNLGLSMQAAYAAPIIMMSQNRQSAKDRLQAELDLRTNLHAETLIEELHGRMEDLRLRQWNELMQLQEQQMELLHHLLHAPEGNQPERSAPAANAPAGNTRSGDAPAGDAPAGDAPAGDARAE
ncbi:MAG: hypothetical protein QOF51_2920, partial [Chloroflexota bacterium]|nr:hypothetical protein [Chloroflexota bacterium]